MRGIGRTLLSGKILEKGCTPFISKLSCLPVINSAFNSFSILLSKSSKAFELATISSNSAPNNLAAVTALAIASGLAPKLALTCPVTLPVSSSFS